MKTVIIDGEDLALNDIFYCLRKFDADIIGEFTSPNDGYDFVMQNKPDVVIMSIGMPLQNGIELGIRIREQLPRISIVYISSYPEFALEAFRAHPVDYLLQPVDEGRLLNTVKHIRNNIQLSNDELQDIPRIQCFGPFKMTTNNNEVKFTTSKARELLAFLLCNYHQAVYKDELVATMFNSGDEKKDVNNFRVTLYRLRHTFAEYLLKKEHLLINDEFAIQIAVGISDLTDFINFTERNKVVDETNFKEAQAVLDSINGELFSDIDTMWIIDMREYFNVKIEELMIKTAQYYISSGKKNNKAEQLLMKLLERNDLSEQGYALLLDFYMMIGNKEKFLHMYRRYAKILKFDLDSKPEREYTEYYIKCKK